MRVIPDFGQVSKDSVEPENSKPWAVLHERVARSYLANNAGELFPQSAALSGDADSFAGATDVLTQLREPATDDEFP